jgi:hypothetical protein
MPRRQASVSKVPIILARKAGMSGHGGRRHFVAWERKGGRQDRGSSRRAVPLGPAMRSILRGERSLNSIDGKVEQKPDSLHCQRYSPQT